MQHPVFTVTTKRYSQNDFRLTSEHNQQFTDLLREGENEERENTWDKHARRLAVLGNANGQIAKTQQFSLTSLAFSFFFSQSAMTFSRDKYYKNNFNFWEINLGHTKDNLSASCKLLAWMSYCAWTCSQASVFTEHVPVSGFRFIGFAGDILLAKFV